MVEAALRQLMHVSARFTITVQQLPSPGRVSSGTGVLDGPASSSEAVININGGGVTEVRQVKGTLLLRSYNTPAQRLNARWVHVNEQLIPQVLKWPPEGMGDPTFAFLSADWPKLLATTLVSTTASESRRIGGTVAHGYQLDLRLFKAAKPPSAGPQLYCWVDGNGHLLAVRLRWPLTAASSGQTSTSGATESHATIILNLELEGSSGAAVTTTQPTPASSP